MDRARVMKSHQRNLECKILKTNQIVSACAKGNLLKEGMIVVGDYVELEFDSTNNSYSIESVVERKNLLSRYLPREKKEKIVASNCDLMVVVTSMGKPEYKSGLVDRYLTKSMLWNIPTLVIFNKMDMHDPNAVDLQFEVERIKDLNATCFEICSTNPNYKPKFIKNGLTELKAALNGKTAIFLGQSGVGKSKIITLLSDGQISLKSNQIGKVGKGVHTTTTSEIFELPFFYLIDSPGIRSYSLDDLTLDDLKIGFPDIFNLTQNCQFHNCKHDEQSKGCGFFANGVNHSPAILSRLESYKKINEELSKTPEWEKKKRLKNR